MSSVRRRSMTTPCVFILHLIGRGQLDSSNRNRRQGKQHQTVPAISPRGLAARLVFNIATFLLGANCKTADRKKKQHFSNAQKRLEVEFDICSFRCCLLILLLTVNYSALHYRLVIRCVGSVTTVHCCMCCVLAALSK